MKMIGTRLDESEYSYVEALAKKMGVKPSRAIKAVLSFAAKTDLDVTKPTTKVSDDLRKMIEQIHMIMPHIMYSSRLSSVINMRGIPESEMKQLQQNLLEDTTQRCGDFQSVTYTQNYTNTSKIGFTQMPIEQEVSAWKLP